jgi:hypothetical protein
MVEQEKNMMPDAPAPPEKKGSWLRDMLYTLNHALACLFTDSFIQPFIGTAVHEGIEHSSKWPSWLKWVGKIFEAHGHGHNHDHEHGHKTTFSRVLGEMGHWFSGEVVGDLTAVPVTATIARFCPWLMKGIRKGLEPLMGWYFKKGAQRDAMAWAKQQGLDPHGPEAEAKKNALYEYEASHFGHMFTWNALSTVFNVQGQFWWRNKAKSGHTGHGATEHTGHEATLGELYFGKIFGLIASNLLLLTARANMPRFFQRNEDAIGKATDKLFGKNENPDEAPTANTAQPQGHPDKKWTAATARDRVQSTQSTSIT